MKTKLSKKLMLNKKTVAHLDELQLDDAKGGAVRPTYTCGGYTCPCYHSDYKENCPTTSNPAIYPGLCDTEGEVCC